MSKPQIEARIINHFSYRELGEDIHIVKEVTVIDGKEHDDIRIIKDFKRPFWVTKPIYQKYTDKKESEDLNKVDMFKATQSLLYREVAKRLGSRYIGVSDPRLIKESPYVYGLDIDSRTFLKHMYDKRLTEPSMGYRVGFFDIEVDTIKNDIIIISLITKDKLTVAILNSFVDGTDRNKERINNLYNKYIPEDNGDIKHKVDVELKFFHSEVEMIRYIFQSANYANIDILAAWNVKYDITEILDKLEEYDVDPADIFHYDKIPEKYKFFNFKEGRAKKITEAGREMSYSPEEIWHNIKCTANYTILDAMASHRYIRVGGATIPGGYSLDNILKAEGITGKLKFNDGEDVKFKGLEWHIHMVKNKPLEYIIYNMWDTMSLMAMEMKTTDLSSSLPLLSGISHFDIFNSGPRRIVDAMFFFYLEHKKVMGVKAYSDTNDKILGLDNWVITLKSHLVTENKNRYITVDGKTVDIVSNIRRNVCDADMSAAYPSSTIAANVSQETTHKEIVKIGEFNKEEFKSQNMDLMYGPTNAVEYCSTMFDMPGVFEILREV